MTEHEWLTAKDIQRIRLWDENDYDRLPEIYADIRWLLFERRKMRELLASCEPQLPRCTRDQEDIEYMLEVTRR